MNGWLIYKRTDAEKNAWFIGKLKEALSKGGLFIELKIIEEGLNAPYPDFAIVRSIAPEINEKLEKVGVRVLNNAQTARIACDKWKTYLLCKELNVPVLPTSLSYINAPTVVKARMGHGGTEVFWVENAEEAKRYGNGYIFQEPCKCLGKDMRVYVIGGEIVACVLREAKSGFRSNFSLGGRVTLCEADENQKAIVKKLYERLRFDYVGIDFLPTEKGWVLNEIEDAAGARMLYACSNIDIVTLFANHVIKTKK